jgi:hypothetical protein
MSKLQRLEENLETVKAYEAKCIERHQAALAEAHEAEVQVELAREAYVLEPSDKNAKAISVARERAELAQLRCSKPAKDSADAHASVVAAQQALETERQEQIAAEAELELKKCEALLPRSREQFAALWRRRIEARQAERQAIEEMRLLAGVVQGAVRQLALAGRAPSWTSDMLLEYPVTEIFKQCTPPGNLLKVQDHESMTSKGGLVVTSDILNLLLDASGGTPSAAELQRVRAFFDRGARPLPPVVEVPPQLPPCREGTISHYLRDSDGDKHEIQVEIWSDGSRRVPTELRTQAARILSEEWSFAEAEVRRAKLIAALPDVLPPAEQLNANVHTRYLTSGESQNKQL